MSLQVWLPLNGNLNNQGISDLTFISTNIVSNESGKIGKCYDFSSSSNSNLRCSTPISLGDSFSLDCWVKINSFKGWDNPIHFYPVDTTKSALSFCINPKSDNTSSMTFTMNGHDYYAFTPLTTGTWYHVCATYNGTDKRVRMYLDGILKRDVTITTNYSSKDKYYMIVGNRYSNGYNLDGYLNDVRLYDHCLSSKEVKEISKCLVCHYPMNCPEGTRNLALGTTKTPILDGGGNSSNGWSEWTVTTVDGARRMTCTKEGSCGRYDTRILPNYARKSNTIYTLSYMARASRSINSTTGLEGSYDTVYGTTNPTLSTEWKKYVWIGKVATNSYAAFVIYPGTDAKVEDWIEVKNIKIEEGANYNPQWTPSYYDDEFNTLDLNGFINDSSGYGYNATRSAYNYYNYWRNTSFSNGTSYWSGVNESVISITTKSNRTVLTGVKGTTDNIICQPLINHTYEAGKDLRYELSVEVQSDVQQTLYSNIWVATSSGWKSANTTVSILQGSTLKVGWNKVYIHYRINNSSYSGQVFISLGCSSTTICIYRPKVCLSNAFTAWKPNDNDSEYSSFNDLRESLEYSLISPKYNNCQRFFGKINYCFYNKTTDFNYTDNFSWSLWMNPFSIGILSKYVFTVGRADTGGFGYGFEIENSTSIRVRYGNYHYAVSITSGNLDNPVWTHVAWTKEGNILKTYINGKLSNTTTFAGTHPTYSDGDGIGIGCFHYRDGDIYPYYGDLSDFRLYHTALSAEDVAELYNSPISISNNGALLTQGEVVES